MTIIDDIWSLLNSVWTDVTDITEGIKITIGEDIFSLSDGINKLVSGILSSITSAVTSISGSLTTVQTNIEGAISNLEDDITSSLDDILNGLKENIEGAVKGIQNAFDSVSKNVAGYITQGLSDTLALIQSIGNGISITLSSVVNGLVDSIGGLISDITGQISDIQSEISNTLTSVTASIGGLVGEILEGLSGLNTTINTVLNPKTHIEFIQEQVRGFNQHLAGNISQVANKKAEIINRIVTGKVKSFEELSTLLTDPPVEYDLGTSIANLIWSFIGGLLVIPDVAKAYGQLSIQEALYNALSTKLSPAELAAAFVQSYMSDEDVKKEARYSGVSPDRMQTLINIAGEPPGHETVLELLNRKFLTEEQSIQAIKESRLKPKYTDAVLKLREVLPPISDIIQFAVKDTFSDEIKSRFGLDDKYPDEIDEYLKQKGLSNFWSHKYWQSHWRLLSVEQVFEMLWRNPETGITNDDVDKFLQQADIAPYWRDKLKAIAYKPYTRVDLRRMYKTKDLDYNGVLQGYLDIGYNQDRAKRLADFTVHLEDETGTLSPDNQERRLFNQTVDLYIYGFRSRDDLARLARSFDWKQTAIENELRLADWRKEEHDKRVKPEIAGRSVDSLQGQIINTLITLYVQGHRELGDIERQANQFGWQPDSTALELVLANLKKEASAKVTKKEELRDLSINAILNAMTIHAITEPDALLKLINVGLSQEDAAIEIQIAQFNETTRQRNEILSAVRSSFKEGLINETQVLANLTKYGFPPDEITSYIGAWTLESSLKYKTFTEAQLASFVKYEVINLEQYRSELKKQGWNDAQIEWWIKLRRGS